MRDRLCTLLRQLDDVQVDCAATEQEADEFTTRQSYDVALVDLQLNPKPTGQLAGLRYASRLADRGCQTIIVTGDARDFLSEVGMALTGSDIVTKPISDVVLLGHVERALEWRNRNASAVDLPPDLVLDPFKQCCQWRGQTIQLTPTELSIVKEIWHANGQRVDLGRLISVLKSGSGHAVTQHIANIRRKFESVDPDFDKISCHGGAYLWAR
ncbi:response regulator [Azoarcus sp. DN11]|uniref:response regulator transcription factor n=1 Tax=Azoarcus sp. DN11 TaxID=356837 RepID=UPI000FE20659|nr:response regulator [Azoarcus sp. DN11]